jgi:hypothetical protein
MHRIVSMAWLPRQEWIHERMDQEYPVSLDLSGSLPRPNFHAWIQIGYHHSVIRHSADWMMRREAGHQAVGCRPDPSINKTQSGIIYRSTEHLLLCTSREINSTTRPSVDLTTRSAFDILANDVARLPEIAERGARLSFPFMVSQGSVGTEIGDNHVAACLFTRVFTRVKGSFQQWRTFDM